MSKNKYYTIHRTSKLLEFINENLTPNLKNKKEHGEVFTPISLVKEMLDKLPKNVWINPDLKWLDPSVGIGNFAIIVYLELMKGLENWEPDEEKRRKHILENMLYMVDISKKNIYILKKIFCDSEYKLNIFEGSFIDDVQYKVYNPEIQFDIIIGNPPYNDSGGISTGGKNLYTKFLNKSIDLLNKKNGEILFITPISIFKTTNDKKTDLFEKISNLNINFINFNEPKKFFTVGSTFCYYNISTHNRKKTFKTVLNNKEINGEIYDINFNWLPLIPNKKTYSILQKTMKNNLNCIREDKPITLKNKVYFKRKNHINYNNPSFKPNISYGNIKETGVITIHDNSLTKLKTIKTVLESPLYKFIYININYDGVIYHKLLNLFGIPENIINNPTDQDIYNYYGITKKEQELIEEILVSSKKSIKK